MKVSKRLKKKYKSFSDDLYAQFLELQSNPKSGVDLGGGLRKVRMAITSKGKGKSGGARIITFIAKQQEDNLILLTLYDKSERENITSKEIEQLLKSNEI